MVKLVCGYSTVIIHTYINTYSITSLHSAADVSVLSRRLVLRVSVNTVSNSANFPVSGVRVNKLTDTVNGGTLISEQNKNLRATSWCLTL